MGCKLFDCQHGKDRNVALKRKHQRQRDEVSKYISNPGVMIPSSTVNYYISYFDPNNQGVVQINLGYVVLSVCFSGWRFTGPMVIPAISEFIQIVNIGAHWVCISTLGCQAGIVRIFDSLYSKPSSVAIDHACRILHHPKNTVTFLNKRVQDLLKSVYLIPWFAITVTTTNGIHDVLVIQPLRTILSIRPHAWGKLILKVSHTRRFQFLLYD